MNDYTEEELNLNLYKDPVRSEFRSSQISQTRPPERATQNYDREEGINEGMTLHEMVERITENADEEFIRQVAAPTNAHAKSMAAIREYCEEAD